MRTQALRVTVGAYSPDAYHVSIIHDYYERGMLVDSVMMWGPLHCGWARLGGLVQEALEYVHQVELDRLKLPAAG